MSNKKGISLIVLVITIVVIIILAAAVIVSFTANNPIESANQAKFKSDIRAFQDELTLKIMSDYAENQGVRTSKINASGATLKIYIPSMTTTYESKLSIVEDKLTFTGIDEKEVKWFSDLIK